MVGPVAVGDGAVLDLVGGLGDGLEVAHVAGELGDGGPGAELVAVGSGGVVSPRPSGVQFVGTDTPRLSVIVPVFNEVRTINAVLQWLSRLPYPPLKPPVCMPMSSCHNSVPSLASNA